MHIAKLENLKNEMEALGEKISEQMLISKILNTLPAEYAHFHSAWDSTPIDKMTLNNLTSRLLIEEGRLNNKEGSSESEAYLSHFKKNHGKEGRKCHKCGKIGHLMKDCRSNGQGSGSEKSSKQYSSRGNSDTNSQNGIKCYNCGKIGHMKRDCRVKASNEKKSFIAEAMLTDVKGCNNTSEKWFIDSGATAHMTPK